MPFKVNAKSAVSWTVETVQSMNTRAIAGSAAAVAAGLLAAYAFGVSMMALRWLLSAVVLAVVVSASAEPFVRILETRFARRHAVRIVMSAGLATLVLFGWVFTPALVRSVTALLASAPELIAAVAAAGSRFGLNDAALVAQLNDWVGSATELLRSNSGSIVVSATGVLGTAGLVLFLSYYLVMDGPAVRSWVVGRLSATSAARFLRVWDLAMEKVGLFMIAQTVLAFVAGVTVTTVAAVLGLPFPVGLGAWATLASLVPLLGGTLSAVLPMLAAITADLGTGYWYTTMWMGAAMLGFQAVDNYVMRPKVTGHMMRLHPVVVVLAVLAGASTLGALGALVSVPAAAVAQGLFSEWEALRNPA